MLKGRVSTPRDSSRSLGDTRFHSLVVTTLTIVMVMGRFCQIRIPTSGRLARVNLTNLIEADRRLCLDAEPPESWPVGAVG